MFSQTRASGRVAHAKRKQEETDIILDYQSILQMSAITPEQHI